MSSFLAYFLYFLFTFFFIFILPFLVHHMFSKYLFSSLLSYSFFFFTWLVCSSFVTLFLHLLVVFSSLLFIIFHYFLPTFLLMFVLFNCWFFSLFILFYLFLRRHSLPIKRPTWSFLFCSSSSSSSFTSLFFSSSSSNSCQISFMTFPAFYLPPFSHPRPPAMKKSNCRLPLTIIYLFGETSDNGFYPWLIDWCQILHITIVEAIKKPYRAS